MIRFFAKTTAVCMAAVLLLPVKVQALSARRGAAMDAVTGRMYFSRGVQERALIASTTKIMTALVVCEQCNVLDQMRIPPQAVGIEGSSMYLKAGEVLTLQELLYGLMLSSGNDAAVALAIYCGGTVPGFVERMNDKARLLGLSGTHFANPNGLDHPQHYSCAGDLAVLAAYAMENPIFAQTVSTKTIQIGDRYLRNHNKLLWLFDGADGVKTGYTRAAGRTLVSSAAKQGRRVVAVTLDAPEDWKDHQELLRRGLSDYQMARVVSRGEPVGSVAVVGSDQRVELLAAEDFNYPLAPGEAPQLYVGGKDFVYAPVTEGEKAGTCYVLLAGKIVGKVPVVYAASAEEVRPEPFFKRYFH